MANKDTCASRLRKGLVARNMTQADLCRMTGIPKSAMSQSYNGGLVPRQDRTFLIASVLNVSEAWLMGFDVPMDRTDTTSPSCETDPLPVPSDSAEDHLLALYRELNPEGQDKLIDYADDMVRSGKYKKNHPSALDQKQD